MSLKKTKQSAATTKFQFLTVIFCFSIFAQAQAQAFTAGSSIGKPLLISDIDDTIRPTHILHLLDKYTNQLTADQFLGMSSLFRLIEKQNPDVNIYYVTNAPEAYGLNFLPSLYLYTNNFPQQEHLSLKNDSNAEGIEKKVPRIVQLIENLRPSMLILIGDNGQVDVGVYREIQKLYPQIPTEIYIHQVYSVQSKNETGAVLASGQMGFVSALDIAMDLFRKDIIQANGLVWLTQKISDQILAENYVGGSGDTAFYSWVDCRDYVFSNRTDDLPIIIQPSMQKYFAKLNRRCSIPSIR